MLLRQIPGISGLFYCDAFLSTTQQRNIMPKVQSVLSNIARASGTSPAQAATVPQPTRSKHHNLLKEERSFVRVQVPDAATDDDTHTILNAETFADYGSRGHSLTYFRGNVNLPSFGRHVVDQMMQLPEFQASFDGSIDNLHWKMTLNHYAEHESPISQADRDAAAFPWHTDIAANGEVTAIATLCSPGQIEFRHHDNEPEVKGIELSVGSLLLLTGPSRWNWLHRVLQSPDERISLVFGAASLTKT